MNYETFVAAVEEAVRESLPSNRIVQINCVRKNNGKERVGITITEQEVNLSPTFYLEEHYEHYMKGESLEEIVEGILNLYEEVRFEKNWDTSCLLEFEQVRGNVVFKIIHTGRNLEFLQTVPHEEVLDLSLVCYVLLRMEACGTATVPVTNHLMELWGVKKEELFALAKGNAKELLKEKFYNMQCVVKKHFDEEPIIIDEAGMHVLTNDKGSLGAAVMMYDGVLADIGHQLGESYYIIPSSIHEVLVLPEKSGMCRDELDEMVKEVNEHCVAWEEVLSDHVYFYDVERKALTM